MSPHSAGTSLQLGGSARARGIAYGTKCRTQIWQFLNDGLTRLDYVANTQIDRQAMAVDLQAYGSAIKGALPAIWSEIEGLAEGACITLDDAVLLQCRREMMGYTKFPVAGDCTSLATSHPHPPMMAQTIDLTCEMQDHIQILNITGPDIAGGGARVFSFTGLLGYLGLNDAGLAVGLNLVLGGDWKPGVPPYLAIRHLINSARTVDEAIAILRQIPLASSRNFMLCDQEKAAAVEVLDGELRVLSGPVVVHANHFLHPDFEARDDLNVFARNSSVHRLDAMSDGWHALGNAPDDERMFSLMSQAPINVSGPYDMRREKTAAAVVLRPKTGTLALRRGDPATATTELHDIKEMVDI